MVLVDFVIVETVQAILNFCIAALFLGARPSRLPNAIAASLFIANGIFSAYSAAHHGQIVYLGMFDLDALVPLVTSAVTWAGLIIFPFFFPRRRLSARVERLVLGGAIAFVLVHTALAVFAVLFLPNETNTFPNNPGYVQLAYTSFTPFFLGLAVGVVLLLDTFLSSPSRIQRDQARLILAAYLIKIAGVLGLFAKELYRLRGRPSEIPLWLLDAWTILMIGALALVPIALVASRLRRSATGFGRAPSEDLFLLAFLAFGFVLWFAAPEAEYNLVRPLLFAYGILQYQTLDVDLRERRTLVATTLIAGIAAVFIGTASDLRNLGADPSVATAAGFALTAGLTALLAVPILRLALAREGPQPEPRGRDLYRAALEEAVAAAKGHSTSEDRVLRSLRARLGISDREHQLLEASVRASFGKPADGLAVGRRFLDRYHVDKLLGEGGFGRTYLARDEQTGRQVVVKAARVESPEEGKRVLREARHLARTQHPNVVTIYDIESVGESFFLVLEYVDGGSLAQRLAQGPLPWRESVRTIDDVLAALEAAHAEGLIHRDIKPANILLTRTGRAKLADFGVAHADPRTDTVSGFSIDGHQPGSLEYMSPEQVRGRPLDVRSDLYSVAVVLYEAIAGRPYLRFQGRAAFDARLAILEEEPALPLEGAPSGISELLADVLSKDPARRPASAEEMRRRLRAATPLAPDTLP